MNGVQALISLQLMIGLNMLKLAAFISLLGVCGTAWADWTPHVETNHFVTTVEVGGKSVSGSHLGHGYDAMVKTLERLQRPHQAMEKGLGDYLRRVLSERGVEFTGGTLSGNMTVSIQPQGAGVSRIDIGGLSYTASARVSGRKYGFISYKCDSTIKLRDISIIGRYGARDGVLDESATGIDMVVESSSHCGSSLQWLMPGFGNLLVNKVEGYIDAEVKRVAAQAANSVKKELFFDRDDRWRNGLAQLFGDTPLIVPSAAGPLNVGQYVLNNMDYLLASGSMAMRFGGKLKIESGWTMSEPPAEHKSDVLQLSVNSPAFSFSLVVTEHVLVNWQWVCSLRNPQYSCDLP